MASLKAEKPVGTQLFGHVKKEPAAAKTTAGGSKAPASKPAPKKAAAPKTQEPKRKAKGGKSAAKQRQ